MTPQQIQLVQDSFALVAPRSRVLASIFYHRLFVLNPSLRRMFPADLTEQKKKLTGTLRLAVESLTKIDRIIPALETLGRSHAACGVRDEHYEVVGAALILTLRQMLGVRFTSETKGAWLETYALVAGAMRRAAAPEATVASAA